jgi:hypothetical protein
MFRGKVVHITLSKDQGFEFGIRIEQIENQDRIALTRFVIQKYRSAEFDHKVLHN